MTINFRSTRADARLITEIARRAVALARGADTPTALDLQMDLTACHLNGCKLDLAGLLAASDADLAHDVFGIGGHIDRDTAQLRDCFSPRYTAR